MFTTSFRSVVNAGEPNAGGGGDRNCDVEFSKYGLTPPRLAPAMVGVGIQYCGPTGTVPVNGNELPSFCRWVTIA